MRSSHKPFLAEEPELPVTGSTGTGVLVGVGGTGIGVGGTGVGVGGTGVGVGGTGVGVGGGVGVNPA